MEVKGIFAALRTTVRGLSTEMKRMNAISENIANSDRTPDKNGKVYKRKIVVENPSVGGKTNFSSRLKSSRQIMFIAAQFSGDINDNRILWMFLAISIASTHVDRLLVLDTNN